MSLELRKNFEFKFWTSWVILKVLNNFCRIKLFVNNLISLTRIVNLGTIGYFSKFSGANQVKKSFKFQQKISKLPILSTNLSSLELQSLIKIPFPSKKQENTKKNKERISLSIHVHWIGSEKRWMRFHLSLWQKAKISPSLWFSIWNFANKLKFIIELAIT